MACLHQQPSLNACMHIYTLGVVLTPNCVNTHPTVPALGNTASGRHRSRLWAGTLGFSSIPIRTMAAHRTACELRGRSLMQCNFRLAAPAAGCRCTSMNAQQSEELSCQFLWYTCDAKHQSPSLQSEL